MHQSLSTTFQQGHLHASHSFTRPEQPNLPATHAFVAAQHTGGTNYGKHIVHTEAG